ncbi:hypothetical protein [Allorhizocola rhizosphaerae]|uniref:hypothetical protein n=1 Tax=Allorhizocola rhizosphaerae TaxID=1872709 RepID=UPI000E3CA852|nr:hypothetical protein [Allorhizocola rhizosphaerae]
MWALIRRAVLFELRLWRSLYRWIARRPVTREPGAVAFSNSSAIMPAIIGFIVVSIIEIPILHLLLPWRTVQIISFVVGAQAVLWMIGYLAAVRIHPHIVGASGLQVRNSTSVDFTIPWESVSAIQTRMRSLTKNRTVVAEGDVLHIAVSSQTNVDVILKQPIVFRDLQVSEVRLYADDPRALAAAARAKLPVGISS